MALTEKKVLYRLILLHSIVKSELGSRFNRRHDKIQKKFYKENKLVVFLLICILIGSAFYHISFIKVKAVSDSNSINEGLDNFDLTFVNDKDQNEAWIFQTDVTHDGSDSIRSGEVDNQGDSWLSAEITGPCKISYWWKVSCEEGFDDLSFYIDYNIQKSISNETDWIEESFFVPNGIHVIQWHYSKDWCGKEYLDCGMVDELRIEEGVQFEGDNTINEALDNLDLQFETGGNETWQSQYSSFVEDGDAAKSGDIDDGEYSYLSTEITGPCTLSFWWKVSSESSFDELTFSVDGRKYDEISGEIEWNQRLFTIEEGTHNLEWNYSKDGSVSEGFDCGFLDAIIILDRNGEIDLNESLDNDEYHFQTGGNSKWFGQDIISGAFNNDTAMSGYIDDGEYSYLSTEITGSGYISFYWKVSSESGFDELTFSVDGEELFAISGEVSWDRKFFFLEQGTHVLEWNYSKDGSVSEGFDCGFVDYVIMVPELKDEISISEVVDLNYPVIWKNDCWKESENDSSSPCDNDCLRAEDSCEISFELNLEDKANINFWWKYNGESPRNSLIFLHTFNGGEPKEIIKWDSEWDKEFTQFNHKLNRGHHILEWKYEELIETESNEGAFLDWISITPRGQLNQVFIAPDSFEDHDISELPGHYKNPLNDDDIKWAIDITSEGGYLFFNSGTYYIKDDINIDKAISIKSEETDDEVNIYLEDIKISSNNVNLDNLNLFAPDFYDYKLDIQNSRNIKISNCTITDIWIDITDSEYITISENIILDSFTGIYASNCKHMNIIKNWIKSKSVGILISNEKNYYPWNYPYCDYNIEDNTITDSEIGIYLYAAYNTEISHNEISNNYVCGLLLYYSSMLFIHHNNILNNGNQPIAEFGYDFLTSRFKNVYFEDCNVHFLKNHWRPNNFNPIFGFNLVNGITLPIIKIGFPRSIKNRVLSTNP